MTNAHKHMAIPTVFIICLLFFLLGGTPVFAQSLSSGVATYITIPGKTIQPGSIISFSNKNYTLSKQNYDPTAFSVTTNNPSVDLESIGTQSKNSYAILTSGKVLVRVSTINGPIHPGDLITTSTIPGVGQKVSQDGFVIGTALEEYDSKNPKQIGMVLTSLNFGFFTDPTNNHSNLLSDIREALVNPYLGPAGLLRYLAAALVVIISFGFGIGYFGRVVTAGVEALGRNPLASRIIMTSVVLNLAMMLTVLVVGIVIAYLILVI